MTKEMSPTEWLLRYAEVLHLIRSPVDETDDARSLRFARVQALVNNLPAEPPAAVVEFVRDRLPCVRSA